MKAAQQSEPLAFIQMHKVRMIYSSVAQRKQVVKIIPARSRNHPGDTVHTPSADQETPSLSSSSGQAGSPEDHKAACF